ncbi:TetR/AcrR family transcriptional regulator [Sphingobacterium deserti]|uniref:Regulatory protein TetR n=1 Tax=Sphingobacterium deserti TaxID=1229276 RepID=A0A0B8T151_9SPHI|nr:TetR/AcrR family transcriptional regulator [Sphingobacterium deserti]KGE14341.1 regulatory protein TetR [Sphingobacterium deserti]
MNRKNKKTAAKSTRNRLRSKNILLESVGNILAQRSYSELNVTSLTEISGLNPKLIYLYFGGLEGLIAQYLENRELQPSAAQKLSQNIALHPKDVVHEDILSLLEIQLDELIADDELKGILHWGFSAKNLKAIATLQMHERTLQKALDILKVNQNIGSNFDSVAFALLAAGATFLAIQSKNNKSSLLNVDLHDEHERKRIKDVLQRLLVSP